VRRPVLFLVRQLEKHRVHDIQPAHTSKTTMNFVSGLGPVSRAESDTVLRGLQRYVVYLG
jgi:hypothetical protein